MKENILIVGAGPTGMTLACMLAKIGIKAKIVDKRLHSSSIPRAINITSPVLKIFDYLGIGGRVYKNGLKFSELKAHWNGKPLLNINYKYYKPSHPYFIHLEQSKIECYLSDCLGSYGVGVARGETVTDLVVNSNDISVQFTKSNGEVWWDSYTYVIGCDGGNSTIRNLAGIGTTQETYPSHFILVDGEISHQYKNGLSELHYYLSENGYLIVAPLGGNKCRLIASVKGAKPALQSNSESIDAFKKILLERAPSHVNLKKILWNASANYFHRISTAASKGNIYLAGDALHQFSPVGGANMNVGIQDSFSLGEKIAKVMLHGDDVNSLNSYSNERLSIAKKYIEATSVVTNLLTRTSVIDREEEKKYFPIMSNRKFIKHTFPEIFSGEFFLNQFRLSMREKL
jgi:2-polyprenyl-6-methoxyphenol hydroxylase-like FAD-dependent oxidoreductase